MWTNINSTENKLGAEIIGAMRLKVHTLKRYDSLHADLVKKIHSLLVKN